MDRFYARSTFLRKISPCTIGDTLYMGRFYARSKFLCKVYVHVGGALYMGRFYVRSKFLRKICPFICFTGIILHVA